MEAPGYSTAITTPMDLSTLHRNVVMRRYATFDAFQSDLNLLHSNAVKYHTGRNAAIIRLAAALVKKVRDQARNRLGKELAKLPVSVMQGEYSIAAQRRAAWLERMGIPVDGPQAAAGSAGGGVSGQAAGTGSSVTAEGVAAGSAGPGEGGAAGVVDGTGGVGLDVEGGLGLGVGLGLDMPLALTGDALAEVATGGLSGTIGLFSQ